MDQQDKNNIPSTTAQPPKDNPREGRFGAPQFFLELLQENGLADLLGANEQTLFLAESTYIQDWNDELNQQPEFKGLDEFDAYIPDGGENEVQICIVFDDGAAEEAIYITYKIDGTTGRYAVEIIHNDVLVYVRTAAQDERTEWELNAMANSATDENGNFIFVGEHTNI